ncbi:uncharacterized protein Z520_02834 [Fonsecaea multimorphosa CBS 102226]|uniref:Saccharopine dehydrogenase NADP binding domain-containing protein n=1 Tax=Fonsecaea multimorphosa CBS 102226 TaxID=1442371 RepID=A0A0D2IW55_9EURO|nr:uncharacterized protein Z520_02834 [Fonsecaea multimorphosa CBS 102226]KIY01282.1 hypothetical protein Z520_02834 [Fonsecaea multimorphosa CBS 102226]OAL28559.1 hypothetical protein AYO22_02753 [Fonsecaea multimorphosa]
MASKARKYDLVLLGATGYTGQLVAEYIQQNVATDLHWAIAGRNGSKLSQLATELKGLNPNRIQPGIEVVELNSQDLQQLAKKTQVLISTVGPFARYGEPVVEACVKSKTHYFDIAGETPFTYDMLHKYNDLAKKNGVVLAPHSGVDSVPADILTFLCVQKIRQTYDVGVKESVNILHEMGGGPSGGSIATIFGLMDAYSPGFTAKALKPHALSPIPPPKGARRDSFLDWILGSRNVQPFGVVTHFPQAECDIGIVHRSWGLYDQGKYYGDRFSFGEYQHVGSRLKAFFMSYIVGFIRTTLTYIALLRWLLKRVVPFPPSGSGPPKAEFQNYRVIFKTVATADCVPEHKVLATLKYKGSPYYLTGVFVVQAALTLLQGGDTLGKRLKGMVTPATWGMELVNRIEQQAGVELDVSLLD